MKRTLLIILLGIGLMNTSFAQQYFNIRNHFHSSSTVLTSVVEHNKKYYITGLCIDSSNYINPGPTVPVGIKFLVLDSTGNKLIDTFYQKGDQEAIEPWDYRNLYFMPDNTLIMASQYYDSGIDRTLIIRFDTLGNKLWEREYDQPICNDNIWYQITDLKPTGTGEWLMLCNAKCDAIPAPITQHVMLLQKLDSNFNIIWTKHYESGQANHIPTKVIIDQDGYLIAGRIDNYNTNPNSPYIQPELVRVDTAGVWQWTWIRAQGGYYSAANDVIRTKDGGYIYCGQGSTQIIAGDIAWQGWIEKLDTGRNIVWSKRVSAAYTNVDYNQLNVLKELPDSSIIVAGGITGGYDIADSSNDIMYGGLMRLKSDGTVIWQRKYRVVPEFMGYYFYDMKQTSDGGYIMAGQALDEIHYYSPPYQQGWIVKVDSNGCISPTACDATDVEEVTTNINNVKVYPNPAKDNLQISYSNIGNGEIAILDLTGRTLIKKSLTHILDIKGLASGVYVYRVTEKGVICGQGKIVKE